MVVTDVSPVKAHYVTVGRINYVRFGPDSWYEWMGESLEPIFFAEEELEEAFQKWANTPL